LNYAQRVEFEYRDRVAAAIAGKAPLQCRGERDAVNSRRVGNGPGEFAADRFDDVHAIAAADEQARTARL